MHVSVGRPHVMFGATEALRHICVGGLSPRLCARKNPLHHSSCSFVARPTKSYYAKLFVGSASRRRACGHLQ
jgi:hypothetical protein